ncbi:MAG: primosomal protein N', partial [Planctomycetota bacterium]|nr:primosomal protein N' [Planctomycetota bacterium]
MSERSPILFSAEAPAGVYARVAVERGLTSGGGLGASALTYRVPEGWAAAVGQTATVPLGRKTVAGLIVELGGPELAEGIDASRLREIASVSGEPMPAKLLELARWLSEYYVCPLGMVLGTMRPAAVKRGTGLREVVRLVRAEKLPEAGMLKPAGRAALEALARANPSFPLTKNELVSALVGAGLEPRAGARAAGTLIRVGAVVETRSSEVRVRERETSGAALGPIADPAKITLTNGQARASEAISSALGTFSVHLLRGVTGSGKTEVYLRVIEAMLRTTQGAAIVLVPEIALTPQTSERFLARFAGLTGVAVLHSGLTASRRHQEWQRAARGEARVIVGARSAVFAPVPRLGLVVVDEEHDSSYKQDQLPRYHARDVAIKRAQLEGCPVILGSATPSLESWQNAQPVEGKPARSRLHELTERVSTMGPARLPIVKIVDMARERAALRSGPAGARARDMLIGPTMASHLRATLREGGQAILLLNRRGFAGYVGCASSACGWVQQCEHCSVAMVLHHRSLHAGTREHIRCHHCLTEQIVPAHCPECSGRVVLLRPGTQRLEDELAEGFGDVLGADPASAVLRVDSDTMRSAPDYFEAFARFASGAVRVLIGTQMLAKGLDFPNVRLVGIVDADTGLGLADFRASERTFQLISQV